MGNFKNIIVYASILIGLSLAGVYCFLIFITDSQKIIYLTSPEELKIKLQSDSRPQKRIFVNDKNSEYQVYPNTRIFKILYDIDENNFLHLAEQMNWQLKFFDKQRIVCVKNLSVTFTYGFFYGKTGTRKYIENVFNNFIVSEGIEVLYDRKLKKCFFSYISYQISAQ